MKDLAQIAAKLRYHVRRSNNSELTADLTKAADILERWPSVSPLAPPIESPDVDDVID